jgi:F0F1-type ATP synthase membrane subunit b/b'
MKVQVQIVRASVFALSSVILPALSRAAQEGATSGGHVVATDTFKWVHFVIVAAAAFWLFKKVLPPKFRQNAERISSEITKATLAKAEAERRLREATAKLAGLEQEMTQFRAQAQKDTAAELQRLRAVTGMDAEKVSKAAKAEIEAAERAARIELKELAAKLAMDRAESLVVKELTPALQEAMLNDFVQSLQGRPN